MHLVSVLCDRKYWQPDNKHIKHKETYHRDVPRAHSENNEHIDIKICKYLKALLVHSGIRGMGRKKALFICDVPSVIVSERASRSSHSFQFFSGSDEKERRRRRGNIFSLLFQQTLSMAAGLLIISSQSRVCSCSMDNRQRASERSATL